MLSDFLFRLERLKGAVKHFFERRAIFLISGRRPSNLPSPACRACRAGYTGKNVGRAEGPSVYSNRNQQANKRDSEL
jgi:hypothetical protein